VTFAGVILDIDGTLVLSNDAHARAWVEAFATFGYNLEFDRVRPLIGMGGDRIIPKFLPGFSDKEGEGKKIADRRKELIIDRFSVHLAPAKGSRDLIIKMQQKGLRLLIASSATSQELSVLLKAARVDDLLSQDEATTSSDAESSKPEPDLVEVALDKLGMQADRVVMLGDSPYDIEAAKKVGVGTIALRCGGFSDSQLKDAIAIYNDPADLLIDYNNSPLGKEAAIEV
jgi:phosphoglycolate phosphatase-like HAD superfamily hydrolase